MPGWMGVAIAIRLGVRWLACRMRPGERALEARVAARSGRAGFAGLLSSWASRGSARKSSTRGSAKS
eukprot:3548170-Alexandrium_andersonii.AAC.1